MALELNHSLLSLVDPGLEESPTMVNGIKAATRALLLCDLPAMSMLLRVAVTTMVTLHRGLQTFPRFFSNHAVLSTCSLRFACRWSCSGMRYCNGSQDTRMTSCCHHTLPSITV
jgi:hypothetical protein